MKRRVKLFYAIFVLFVMFLAALDLMGVFRSSGNVILEDKVEVNNFAVRISDHSYNNGNLVLGYQIFNAAEEAGNVEVGYQIVNGDGIIVKEGSREAIFDPYSDNKYKLIIPMGYNGNVARVRISVFNGYLSAYDESSVYSNKGVTGFAVSNNNGEVVNLLIGAILLIAIILVSRKIYSYSMRIGKTSKINKGLIPIKVN